MYICHYNDSITQNETENADSAFIFFNDPKILIAPGTGNAVIDVLPNKLSSVEIPCIPTNSKTEVTLVKAYSTVTETKRVQLKPMKVEPGSIEDFTYDPKVGFHIKRESLDGSSLFCNFTLNNETQIVQVVVYFPIDQEANSIPEIDSSLAKKVVVYGRFALICKFEISGDIRINMQWLYPKSRDSIIRVKQPVSKKLSFGKQNVTIYSQKIIVSKTSLSNEGWYVCRITDSRGKSYETRKFVTVYDSTKKPFVELSNDYSTNSVKTRSGEQLKLRVYINAFPRVEFDGIYWLRDGRVIDALNSERYITNYTDNEASLEIVNVTSQDIAFYSLKVSTEQDVVSENTIHVLIEGEPFISLSADNQTARKGSKHKIACHAIGYPPPTVDIFYTNCTQNCENATVIKIEEEKHLNEESVKIDKQVNKKPCVGCRFKR
ncbi:Vascular endothelial growth factor receptor 3-like protein [Leptotrombidium deliense]|uniref:Platelet-derived growth factor receptor-like protein n=1 Tax=Leptotrombidium deliense TaxID=299467 RepID=A0A443SFA3_9ACAR|nr:Vascular endothelial growth factor receptor 3-like protein [Leptotrombidium deliense]